MTETEAHVTTKGLALALVAAKKEVVKLLALLNTAKQDYDDAERAFMVRLGLPGNMNGGEIYIIAKKLEEEGGAA